MPSHEKLLSPGNHQLVQDIVSVLSFERGGTLLYGPEGSGRKLICSLVARELQRPVISISLPAVEPSELLFLSYLARRITSRLGKAVPEGAAERFIGVTHSRDRNQALPLLVEGLVALPDAIKPILIITDIDCLTTSHQPLDLLFAALRDVVVETDLLTLVTGLFDVPPNAPTGVSRFLNNFSRHQPRPIVQSDLHEACAAIQTTLPAEEAAHLLVRIFGAGEERVQKAVNYLRAWAQKPRDELERALRETAGLDLRHDGDKFWECIDPQSRQVLLRAARGLDHGPEHVKLLVRHPWSPYNLSQVAPERVEIRQQGLYERVCDELIRSRATHSPEQVDEECRTLGDAILEGNPCAAAEVARRLAENGALGQANIRRMQSLKTIALAVDQALKMRYAEAAELLALLDGTGLIIANFRRANQILRDPADALLSFSPRDIVLTCALEYARSERMQLLGQLSDAYLNYCKLVEWFVGLALRQSVDAMGKRHEPVDALDHLNRDRTNLNIGNKLSLTSLPATGRSLEGILLARALDLAELREVHWQRIQRVFNQRNSLAHRPQTIDAASVEFVQAFSEDVLMRISESFHESFPDRHSRRPLLVPETILRTLTKWTTR